MVGGVAQIAGGLRCAMVLRRGMRGMELSIFSREVIVMATAISLSHNVFDAVLYLRGCDKIVSSLLIGALTWSLTRHFYTRWSYTGQGNNEKEKYINFTLKIK